MFVGMFVVFNILIVIWFVQLDNVDVNNRLVFGILYMVIEVSEVE